MSIVPINTSMVSSTMETSNIASSPLPTTVQFPTFNLTCTTRSNSGSTWPISHIGSSISNMQTFLPVV